MASTRSERLNEDIISREAMSTGYQDELMRNSDIIEQAEVMIKEKIDTETTSEAKDKLANIKAEQEKFDAAGLTERHARALLRLSDQGERSKILDRICKEKPSVALTEAMVDMALTQSAPRRIGKADKLSAIDCFTDSLKASIAALRSLEIDARQTINYYGDKLYITLSISEK